MSHKAIAVAEDMKQWATIGIHPTDKHDEQYDHDTYLHLAKHPRVVAIGECGIDFYRLKVVSEEERKRQYDLFESQIALAIEAGLPLMIHTRSAHDDTLAILRKHNKKYGDKLRGNIHFFTAGYAIAKQYFDLGFTVSFPGVITFSSEYDDAVIDSPIDMIMAETDSPYAAPVPHRGKRNTPANITEIYERVAELRGESVEKMRTQLNQNAIRLFALKP
jgi:TatD DNase family protein